MGGRSDGARPVPVGAGPSAGWWMPKSCWIKVVDQGSGVDFWGWVGNPGWQKGTGGQEGEKPAWDGVGYKACCGGSQVYISKIASTDLRVPISGPVPLQE